MSSFERKPGKKRVFWALLLFFLILLGIGMSRYGSIFPFAYQLLFNRDIKLKETSDHRVNILFLGVGGAKHDGPLLSDTIIFTSMDPDKKHMTLVSIPRDLWVPDLKEKINFAYAYGETKQKGGGILLAKAVVKKVLGQQVDYVIRLDFSGFIKAVDMIGGLDIKVDNTFDDYQYPLEGKENDSCGRSDEEIVDLTEQISSQSATEEEAFPCRYEHLHFEKGNVHMDGQTALKYVRSRHGTGDEGSDFARSKRQEKVISAFKERVLSVDTFLNPVKVLNLFNILKDSIDTDIKQDEFDDFIRLAQKMKDANIKSAVIDAGDESVQREGILKNPPISEEFDNQWVLIPAKGNGDYSALQKYVDCVINTDICNEGKVSPSPMLGQ